MTTWKQVTKRVKPLGAKRRTRSYCSFETRGTWTGRKLPNTCLNEMQKCAIAATKDSNITQEFTGRKLKTNSLKNWWKKTRLTGLSSPPISKVPFLLFRSYSKASQRPLSKLFTRHHQQGFLDTLRGYEAGRASQRAWEKLESDLGFFVRKNPKSNQKQIFRTDKETEWSENGRNWAKRYSNWVMIDFIRPYN